MKRTLNALLKHFFKKIHIKTHQFFTVYPKFYAEFKNHIQISQKAVAKHLESTYCLNQFKNNKNLT